MRRLPSFTALRAFEAAARLGGFQQAGEELHLTPSAISHQIRALETYFARALFIRHSRHVELTPDGVRLQAKLASGFAEIEAACAELDTSEKVRALAVHCAPSLASTWLGPRLPGFMREHPSIGMRLTASADWPDLARHEELDLSIVYGTPPSGPGLVAEPLGIETITALCAPGVAVAFEAGGANFSRLALIESSVCPVRWPDWFALNGLTGAPRADQPAFDRGALAISAAVQGVGVALETTRFAERELARGDLVVLGGGRFQAARQPLHFLCYRQAQKASPKNLAFRAWLAGQIEAG